MAAEPLPDRESMEFDVVIVGAGPAGLAAAIRLKQLAPDLSVVILEKGAEVGAHILSGAVIDPIGLDRLIPDWRGEEVADAAAVTLSDTDGAMLGVATGDMGVGRDGRPKPGFQRGMELRAKYTLIAEGARGSLAKQLIRRFRLDDGREPQKY